MQSTQKETVEYNASFLKRWHEFCDCQILSRRLASHACRIAFMQMTCEERERAMAFAKDLVLASRSKKR